LKTKIMAKKNETTSAPDIEPVDQAAAAEVAAMTPMEAPKGISEDEIREKTLVGLSREEAIRAITRQREHDAKLAQAEKQAAK
jgi:hypothetical protein